MNAVIASGYLTADIETRPAGEHQVHAFTLAVKQGEHTTFLPIEAWDMPHLERFLHKGSKVLVRGSLRQNNWETPEGERRSRFLTTAFEVEFLDRPPREESKAPSSRRHVPDNNNGQGTKRASASRR